MHVTDDLVAMGIGSCLGPEHHGGILGGVGGRSWGVWQVISDTERCAAGAHARTVLARTGCSHWSWGGAAGWRWSGGPGAGMGWEATGPGGGGGGGRGPRGRDGTCVPSRQVVNNYWSEAPLTDGGDPLSRPRNGRGFHPREGVMKTIGSLWYMMASMRGYVPSLEILVGWN